MQMLAKRYITDKNRIFIDNYRCLDNDNIISLVNKYNFTVIINSGLDGNNNILLQKCKNIDIDIDNVIAEFKHIDKHIQVHIE